MFPTVTRTDKCATRLSVAEARKSFAAPGGYLAACSIGLPTESTTAAMTDDLASWQRGLATPGAYSDVVEDTRASFAALMSVPGSNVAIGSQTSVMASVIAAAVPDGAEVLCPLGDFSSMVYPFEVQARRGVNLRYVPVAELAAAITAQTYLVAFSLVQSGTGEVADAEKIIDAAQAHAAYTFCDTTQAAGAMPIDASRFDATACNAYKWLCAPRGVAFMTLTDEFADTLQPIQAGWYAGANVWDSLYGPGMTLSSSACRFDVSPSWPAWVGAKAALEFFARLDLDEVLEHNVALGNQLCARLGLEPRDQAIVSWPEEVPGTVARARDAGVVITCNAGRLRAAFHVWNDSGDVDKLVAALETGR